MGTRFAIDTVELGGCISSMSANNIIGTLNSNEKTRRYNGYTS